MKTQEIARHLLNRRNAMNPMLLPGEMIASLGSEAMQEALQKRWLVPNNESGMLQISPDMAMVEEMRGVSDKCPTCNKTECGCGSEAPANTSHRYAFEHALRRPGQGSPLEEAARGTPAPIQELLSPGTGHDNDGGLKSTATPTTPPASTPMVPPKPVTPTAVGEEAVGTVAKTKDGNLQVQLDQNNPGAKKLAQQLAR